MSRKEIQKSLKHALTALKSTNIAVLPLVKCSFMLANLPKSDSLSDLRSRLARRLSENINPKWLKEAPTYEVFLALEALWKYDQTLVNSESLKVAIQRLLTSEVQVGGPYRTGDSIDLADNLQVALFLKLTAKPLPNLDKLLIAATKRGLYDKTKINPTIFIHSLLKNQRNKELIQYISNNCEKPDWQNPGAKAIVLEALGKNLPRDTLIAKVKALSKKQQSDGFWTGVNIKKNSNYDTSFATTTIVVDFLYKFLLSETNTQRPMHREKAKIAKRAKAIFRDCPPSLKSMATEAIDKACQADENSEITLLPFLLSEPLKPEQRLTDEQQTLLGLASLCGWIAYKIYDDLIDLGNTAELIPLANILMRASIEYYEKAIPDDEFHSYIHEAFQDIDEANDWELRNCRFPVKGGWINIKKTPDYGNLMMLARRAHPHILAPIATLSGVIPKHDYENKQQIEEAFYHYLIARQLNDDLLDWEQDIKSGQVTFVVTTILKDAQLNQGQNDLKEITPIMRSTFLHKSMPKICHIALEHINESNRLFKNSSLPKAPCKLYSLLQELEQSIRNALDAREKSLELIKKDD